jgi:hypothetical protein
MSRSINSDSKKAESTVEATEGTIVRGGAGGGAMVTEVCRGNCAVVATGGAGGGAIVTDVCRGNCTVLVTEGSLVRNADEVAQEEVASVRSDRNICRSRNPMSLTDCFELFLLLRVLAVSKQYTAGASMSVEADSAYWKPLN